MKNDDEIKKLMQEAGMEEPSLNFTADLMKKLKAETSASVRIASALNRKIIIFTSLVFFLLAYLALNTSPEVSYFNYDLSEFNSGIEHFIKSISSPLLLVVLASCALLYALDSRMKTWFVGVNS